MSSYPFSGGRSGAVRNFCGAALAGWGMCWAGTASAGPEPLLWDRNVSQAVSFTNEYDIAADAEAIAVKFVPNTNYWAYPGFTINGMPEAARTFSFEVKLAAANHQTGYQHAIVMVIPQGECAGQNFDYRPTETWQTVKIDLNQLKLDKKRIGIIRIGLNPNSSELKYYLRKVRFLDGNGEAIPDAVPQHRTDLAAEIVQPTDDHRSMVFRPDEALDFRILYHQGVRYRVLDWQNRVVLVGKADTAGQLRLSPLPPGYYRIFLDATGKKKFTDCRSFCIIPETTIKDAKKSPDSLDICASSLVKTTDFPGYEAKIRYYGKLAHHAGIRIARERFPWLETEPNLGKYDWAAAEKIMIPYRQSGLKLSVVIENSPSFAGSKKQRMPTDMLVTYNFARAAAAKFKDVIVAWEFWNEPETTRFNEEAPWTHAAMAKAFYLGVKAGNPHALVTTSGMAMPPGQYMDTLFNSSMAEYCDLFNYHIYHGLKDTPEVIQGIKNFLARYKCQNMKIWITENGIAPIPTLSDPYDPQVKVQSYQQELVWAEFIPKTYVRMQELGVNRNFIFCMPEFFEMGRFDWGMIRYDHSARPAYAAMAVFIHNLGNAEYQGTYELGPEISGYLYGNRDETQTLIAWRKSDLDNKEGNNKVSSENEVKTITFPATSPVTRIDLFGKQEHLIPQNGTVSVLVSNYPTYLSGLSGLAPRQKTNWTSHPSAVEPAYDKTVLVNVFDHGNRNVCNNCIINQTLTIQVGNFSAETKVGKLFCPDLDGLPDKIVLSPREVKTFTGTIKKNQLAFFTITLGGQFGPKTLPPVKLPVCDLNNLNDRNSLLVKPDPAQWESNNAESGVCRISREADGQTLRFDLNFKPVTGYVDYWSYPRMRCPELKSPRIIGVVFDIKIKNPQSCNEYCMVQAPGNREVFSSAYSRNQGDGWQRNAIIWGDCDRAAADKLCIGSNAAGAANFSFQLRNLRLIYRP